MRSAAPLEESAVTHTPGTNAIKGCGGEYDDLEVTENQKMIKKRTYFECDFRNVAKWRHSGKHGMRF